MEYPLPSVQTQMEGLARAPGTQKQSTFLSPLKQQPLPQRPAYGGRRKAKVRENSAGAATPVDDCETPAKLRGVTVDPTALVRLSREARARPHEEADSPGRHRENGVRLQTLADKLRNRADVFRARPARCLVTHHPDKNSSGSETLYIDSYFNSLGRSWLRMSHATPKAIS